MGDIIEMIELRDQSKTIEIIQIIDMSEIFKIEIKMGKSATCKSPALDWGQAYSLFGCTYLPADPGSLGTGLRRREQSRATTLITAQLR